MCAVTVLVSHVRRSISLTVLWRTCDWWIISPHVVFALLYTVGTFNCRVLIWTKDSNLAVVHSQTSYCASTSFLSHKCSPPKHKFSKNGKMRKGLLVVSKTPCLQRFSHFFMETRFTIFWGCIDENPMGSTPVQRKILLVTCLPHWWPWCIFRLLGELNSLGWKLTSSADISAKYLTTKKEKGPSEKKIKLGTMQGVIFYSL